MNQALSTVTQWCTSESMAVAPTKTFHVQFGRSNPDAIYSLNNLIIQRKQIHRDLGFYIKDDCSINDHLDIIAANTNKKLFSVLRKIVTNDEKILIYIFNTYIRPNYEYGSSIFNVQQNIVIDQLEHVQKLFTRILFKRNNPGVTVIPSYYDRLKLYEMDSLHHRRNAADILLAYDFLILHPDPDIDLEYVTLAHRSNGYYRSKSIVKGKFSKTHFSTRAVSTLQKFNIKLHTFSSSDDLRNYISSLNLSGPKTPNANYYIS